MSEAFSAAKLRRCVLNMANTASSGHIACAFSIIEILAVLHRKYLRYPGNDPRAEHRDFLVLSKGHGVMAQYACMRERGWMTDADIAQYYKDGTKFVALSDSRIPGLEVTSGTLGHGFSVGVGIALGLKRSQSAQRVYVIAGDGEMNEGPMWEAALFAAHHRLDNLTLIIDKNGYQALGTTDEVLELGSLEEKLQSFGFVGFSVDGHDEAALAAALERAVATRGKPSAIVAQTVKGKGVSFMEIDNGWHYDKLTADAYALALQEIGAK